VDLEGLCFGKLVELHDAVGVAVKEAARCRGKHAGKGQQVAALQPVKLLALLDCLEINSTRDTTATATGSPHVMLTDAAAHLDRGRWPITTLPSNRNRHQHLAADTTSDPTIHMTQPELQLSQPHPGCCCSPEEGQVAHHNPGFKHTQHIPDTQQRRDAATTSNQTMHKIQQAPCGCSP
jgi:hypothetical protein